MVLYRLPSTSVTVPYALSGLNTALELPLRRAGTSLLQVVRLSITASSHSGKAKGLQCIFILETWVKIAAKVAVFQRTNIGYIKCPRPI